MKKTTIFFLIIGILAMAVGGVGSAVFYQRAKTTMINDFHDTYTIKNRTSLKEVRLTLSGNANYSISPSDDGTVTMDGQSSVTTPLDGTLKASEANDILTVTVDGRSQNEAFDNLDFHFFYVDSTTIRLTIPADVDRVVVDGDTNGRIEVYDFQSSQFEITANAADIHAISTATDKMRLVSKDGDISVYGDTKVEDLYMESDHGNLNVNGVSGTTLALTTSSGDLDLTDVKSNTLTAHSKSGEIYINGLSGGEATFTGKNGSMYLTGEELPKKITATMEHGDIEVDLSASIENVSVKADSELGDIDLLGDKTSYIKGKNGSLVTLKTTTGDISLYGIYSDEDYDYDYEEE